MTKGLLSGLAMLLLTAPLTAQNGVQNRVIGSLDTRLVQPECKLDGAGDFRIASGKTYLKTGIEGTGDQSNRVNGLKNGVRVITEAMTSAGQGKNPAAWYYLGRLYLQQGDLYGADSALTRAAELAPQCAEEISKSRKYGWAGLVNRGGRGERGDRMWTRHSGGWSKIEVRSDGGNDRRWRNQHCLRHGHLYRRDRCRDYGYRWTCRRGWC